MIGVTVGRRLDDNSEMRAHSLLFLTAVVVCSPLLAQVPPASGEREPKVTQIIDRFGDEVRARKAFDAAQKHLKTRAFQQAIRDYAPGKLPELRVSWGEFMTASGTPFLAMHFVPELAPSPSDARWTLFGSFTDANGKVVTDFEEVVSPESSNEHLYFDRTLIVPLQKGSITVGVARGGEVIAIGRATIEPETLVKDSTGISRLILSTDVHPLATAQSPFDPFAFGGLKVVPRVDATFKKGEEAWFFSELRNPPLAADGQPQFSAYLEITAPSGKKTSMPIIASPLKGVASHYGLGTAVETARLAPGEYQVKMSVHDAVRGQEWARDVVVKIVE